MKISGVGVALIKSFEGLELGAYRDIAGVWTIGYGHTEGFADGRFVKSTATRISTDLANGLLELDLHAREAAVNNGAKIAINQNEFDALVSFSYNVGILAFNGSTALKRLNAGDRIGAADALTWWNKATINGVLTPVEGLTRRRAAERELFLSPVGPIPIIAKGDVEGQVEEPGKSADDMPSVTGPAYVRPDKRNLWERLCGKP